LAVELLAQILSNRRLLQCLLTRYVHCVSVCTRARACYKQACARTYKHTHTYTHARTFVHTYVYTCVISLSASKRSLCHTHTHTHTRQCFHSVSVSMHEHLQKHTHTHTNTHTHTFTSCLACIVTRVRAQMLIRVYPHEDTYTERSTEYWQVLCSSVAVCVAGVCVAVCVAGVCIARQGLAAFASSCSQLPLTCCACGMYESE